MAEGSWLHDGQASRWNGELDRGGGPESSGGCVSVKEVSEVLKGELVNGLEGEEQNFINDVKFNWNPIELLQDMCYITEGGG